ncbi:lipase family protein [Nocardioides sp. Root151]|uniref:lipase family protein n=1 Tax=Nocardioides sp. Root151 TaxID=1736475 RepID=UPI0007024439|nr:lipase family protein [Nocardioides sp. Root151]KQZ70228.1 lipase [Nocardioides sp. Root151]
MRKNTWARVAAGALLALSLSPLATASPAQADGTSFYDTPTTLPANNGDIVRSEPSEFYVDPVKLIKADADVQRIMYRSTDRTGVPVAVTGTVLTPKTPWVGAGKRPLIGYAVGTQGMGDQCAPSRTLGKGLEYEGPFIAGLLARGYAIVVTDYEGLGTEGEHTYMMRETQGHAVLDSVRAAQRLPGSGVTAANPVAISGFSQGGGAAASAGELAPTYAPEINLKAVAAGAVPADLSQVAINLDGSLYVSFMGYAVSALANSYGIDMTPMLNAKGQAMMATLSTQCTLDSLATFPFVKSKDLTTNGLPVTDLLTKAPFNQMVADQLIGNGRKPNVPVLITHSALDDVIPYKTGKQLAQRWCGQGTKVQFDTNFAPTHVGDYVASIPTIFLFLEARFAGLPALNSCWRL